MKFFKDSFRELKHVVWPSKEETIKYFLIVLVTLILFGLYLTFADFIFREGIFGLRDIFSK
jgi:preprotein translocase subunit SecE